MHLVRHMGRAPYESVAAPVSNNAADQRCRTDLKLPYRIDSDAALLPDLIHQLHNYHKSGAASEAGLSQRSKIIVQVTSVL